MSSLTGARSIFPGKAKPKKSTMTVPAKILG
uniref:Uncharacterized protein n=1 Tax=Arundo donax TaxID=35708 RepID=A0A0A9EME9_ARUDO